MEKVQKIKIFIALFYLIVVGLFLYFFFSRFSLEEIASYDFIKNNRDYFFQLRQSNLISLSLIFFFFTIFWVFAAGFGTPIAIFAGFIFGKWLGFIIAILGLSIGATTLYVFANFFLKNLIRSKFLNKFKNLEEKFKKSELLYLLIYRFVGGIPFAISNVLPCIFDVKVSNFFTATLIGLTPQLFLIVSIGSGVEKLIDQNLTQPGFSELISSPDIYLPLMMFVCLIIITFFFRNKFYKDK